MNSVQNLVTQFLDQARQLQIATARGDQPWICTVYFVMDNSHNLYWVSKPDRRHSQEIAKNPKVAGSVSEGNVYGQPIRGVQFEGLAAEITDPKEIALHISAYEQRFQRQGLGREIIAGTNPHHLFRITPTRFMLFDKANFPELDVAQEWLPNPS
jgi:uncharacterized protein YhbP (UPF0306 family)